jgi:hypothetical protein
MDKLTVCLNETLNKSTIREVRKDIVMKLYKTSLSSLICGSEMWTLATQEKKKD